MEAVELAAFIRERSSIGALTGYADIAAHITGHIADTPDRSTGPPQPLTLLQETVALYEDMETIPDDRGGLWYFSTQFMTGAYARTLLLKCEGPLRMVAEVIREHSRLYPRPVPLTLFGYPPFSLSHDEMALCLEEMTNKPQYRDIVHLTTSIGNVFAYSTDYLSTDYATMLAEWVDVGQIENP